MDWRGSTAKNYKHRYIWTTCSRDNHILECGVDGSDPSGGGVTGGEGGNKEERKVRKESE